MVKRIGTCVASGKPIFENDLYAYDFDGNLFLQGEVPLFYEPTDDENEESEDDN